MNLFTHHFLSSKLHLTHQSIAIRAAYLMADNVLLGGDIYNAVGIEELLSKFQPLTALRFMAEDPKCDPAMRHEYLETMDLLKMTAKVKHKSPQQIIARKRLENWVTQAWKEYGEDMIKVNKSAGVAQIKVLMEKGENIFYAPTSARPEEKREGFYECSRLLQFNLQEDDILPEQSCFMLPSEFMNQLKSEGKDKVDGDDCNEIQFTYFNLNLLSPAELIAVKRQLSTTAKPFCEAMDKWNALLAEEPESGGFKWFKGLKKNAVDNVWYMENVKPAAEALQEAIDCNEILSSIPLTTGNNLQVYVHLGTCPTDSIWKFFDSYGLIPEETKVVLEQKEARYFAAKRKPYFAISYSPEATQRHDEQAPSDETATPVKKSISFD